MQKKDATKYLLKTIFHECKIKFSEIFLIYYHIGTDEVLRVDNLSWKSYWPWELKVLNNIQPSSKDGKAIVHVFINLFNKFQCKVQTMFSEKKDEKITSLLKW